MLKVLEFRCFYISAQMLQDPFAKHLAFKDASQKLLCANDDNACKIQK